MTRTVIFTALVALTVIFVLNACLLGSVDCLAFQNQVNRSRFATMTTSGFWWWPFSFGPGRVPGISAKSLSNGLKANKVKYFLVDVRSPGEFASGHIPGALNMPVGGLKPQEVVEEVEKYAKEHEMDKKDVEIVCICLSAHRSPPAVRLIKGVDPELDVKQLDYGMANWWLNKFESVKV